MKGKINILLAVSTSLLLSCRHDDNGQRVKDELKAIILDYYNALSVKDLQKANRLTTSNFVLWDEGRIYNNEIAIDSVSTMSPFTATFSIDSLNVHADKKNASAYYFRTAVFTFGNAAPVSIKFLESCTFNKEDDKWKLRFMQSSLRK